MPLGVKYHIPLEVFYRLNPAKMERYQPYFTERMKQHRNETSETGWINGLYVGRAIGGCFPKGKKYPEEPLKLWSGGESADNESEPFTDVDRFAGFAAAFNRSFANKEDESPIESHSGGIKSHDTATDAE